MFENGILRSMLTSVRAFYNNLANHIQSYQHHLTYWSALRSWALSQCPSFLIFKNLTSRRGFEGHCIFVFFHLQRFNSGNSLSFKHFYQHTLFYCIDQGISKNFGFDSYCVIFSSTLFFLYYLSFR